jgi:hypothetical protein
MTDYFVDLKDLVDEKVSLKGSFEPGDIDFSRDNVRQAAALNWNSTAERAGREIRICGSLKTIIRDVFTISRARRAGHQQEFRPVLPPAR